MTKAEAWRIKNAVWLDAREGIRSMTDKYNDGGGHDDETVQGPIIEVSYFVADEVQIDVAPTARMITEGEFSPYAPPDAALRGCRRRQRATRARRNGKLFDIEA